MVSPFCMQEDRNSTRIREINRREVHHTHRLHLRLIVHTVNLSGLVINKASLFVFTKDRLLVLVCQITRATAKRTQAVGTH